MTTFERLFEAIKTSFPTAIPPSSPDDAAAWDANTYALKWVCDEIDALRAEMLRSASKGLPRAQ